MKKVYRVQDLAMSGRKITVDGIEVQFDGFYITVPESIVYYFDRMDEYQVSEPTEVAEPVDQLAEALGYVPAPSLKAEESTTSPYAEAQKTVSPNLEAVTKVEVKPRDDTPKTETPKISVSSTIKPRTAQN